MAGKNENVEQFCKEHAGDFAAWSNAEAVAILRNSLAIAALLTFSGLWTWHKSGHSFDAALSFMPAILTLTFFAVVGSATPQKAKPFGCNAVDLCVALALLGTTHGIAVMLLQGKPVVNGPIQSTLFLGCIFSYHETFLKNLKRSAILTVGIVLFLLATAGIAYVLQSSIQFVIGFVSGMFINYHFVELRKMRFFSISTNQQMRNHAYSELTKIVHPHVVELIQSGYGLEDTMPVGKHNALVMSFDVMGSSGIKSRQFPETLDRIIARCHDAMMEEYTSTPLCARAFPVKDLGDGFLASIGFPFSLPPGRSAVDNALSLAENFVAIFEEEMAKLNLQERAHCCVSIVSGGIEGYFPRAGVKQYELRGHGLVLATRYEGMRKFLLPRLGRTGNFIIVRECVYRNLSAVQKNLFAGWDVRGPGMGVRDDPRARTIYYRFLNEVISPTESVPAYANEVSDPESHLPSVA